jgi:hypothetical protein
VISIPGRVELLVSEVLLLGRAFPARYGRAGEFGATQILNVEVALRGGPRGGTSLDDQAPCYQHLTAIPRR